MGHLGLEAVERELETALIAKLDKGFVVKRYGESERTLILRDVAGDLQVGLVVQQARKHGALIELVDLGMRIPSVEQLCGRYESGRLRKMGFRNPETTPWLTLWRPTRSSRELEQRRAHTNLTPEERESHAHSIHRELAEFVESIEADIGEFRSETLGFLSEARLPPWATMPGSSFLVTKALALRKLHGPYESVDVARLNKNASVERPYDANVEDFRRWLESAGKGNQGDIR